MTDLGGHGNYRQLAEEIGAVLQAAAETAEKMQEDASAEAARIRAEAEAEHRTACAEAARIRADAEAEHRTACAEGRRILDEARMEADMVRAEAEWQSQEIIAHARRQAAERLAGADARQADLEKAESRVIERLAGVGQVLADALAALREAPADAAAARAAAEAAEAAEAAGGDDVDQPTAKVYFVEFPPAPTTADHGGEADTEIVLTENPEASLFADDDERSELAPPGDLPTWWTRGGAQG